MIPDNLQFLSDTFVLTEDDKKIKSNKSKAADFGMAIDNHIKEIVKSKGANISGRFAPYDFELNGEFYDVKSFSASAKTITISANEYHFAKNKNVTYLIFEQQKNSMFSYRGSVTFQNLITSRKLRNSHFNDSFYFNVNVI